MTLLEQLIHLRGEGPTVLTSGICHHCRNEIGRLRHMTTAFKAWPEYSGDPRYPVPGYGFEDAAAAENGNPSAYAYTWADAENPNGLWDRETEYGAARWRLLDHLIEYYTEKGE